MIEPGDIISVDHTRCIHADAEPATTLDGTTVAYLCPECYDQLHETYGQHLARLRATKARQATCEHKDTSEMTAGSAAIRRICDDCEKPLPIHQEWTP